MIYSIVVTYNSQRLPEGLCKTLAAHSHIIVVDNSTDETIRQLLSEWTKKLGYNFIDMHGNAGIATAQNVGLDLAKKRNALGVVFFDQDSLVDDVALTALTDSIRKDATTVYALTPGTHSTLSGVKTPRFAIRELMSSGSGCQMSVFNTVGLFESSLFIDCVDFEWGWRCRQRGVSLAGLRAGVFLHTLGNSSVNVFGMHAHLDSPIRGYYQFRNITAMMCRGYVPIVWKVAQGCVQQASF